MTIYLSGISGIGKVSEPTVNQLYSGCHSSIPGPDLSSHTQWFVHKLRLQLDVCVVYQLPKLVTHPSRDLASQRHRSLEDSPIPTGEAPLRGRGRQIQIEIYCPSLHISTIIPRFTFKLRKFTSSCVDLRSSCVYLHQAPQIYVRATQVYVQAAQIYVRAAQIYVQAAQTYTFKLRKFTFKLRRFTFKVRRITFKLRRPIRSSCVDS